MGHRLLLFSRRSTPSPLLSGLAAYWNLNETGGPRADSLGVSNLTDNNTTLAAPGKIGNAASFVAASNQFLSVASNAALSMGDIDFSFGCWINPTSALDTHPILAKDGVSAAREYNLIQIDAALTWFVFGAAGAVIGRVTHPTPLSAATWYFVVVDHDATNNLVHIYLNDDAGASVVTTGAAIAGAQAFRIGSDNGTTRFFGGLIDEALAARRLWSAAERTQLYNGGSGTTFPFV